MSLLDRILGFGLTQIPKSYPRCAACGEGIIGDCIKALDRDWHPNHFRCGACNAPLAPSFRITHHLEPFCSSHDPEKVICQCCGHLVIGSLMTKGFCPGCATDILTNERDAAVLLGGIQAHLRNHGLPWWPQSFPVRLVGPEAMTASGLQHDLPLLGVISQVTSTDPAGRMFRRVPEIRLLRGGPRLVQGAVIAHELGHAWLFQKGLEGLPSDVEEGFCEYCSHLWLSRNPDPRASYLMERIVKNPDPTYGGGFRKVRDMAGDIGIDAVLPRIQSLSR